MTYLKISKYDIILDEKGDITPEVAREILTRAL